MIRLLENAVLSTDLDAQNKSLLNVKGIVPVPGNLVGVDDPRLSDQRAVQDGSVTDNSVSATADITQDKLNLNGAMPAAWIGNGSDQAAQGNLVERVANKGASGGYVPLQGSGKFDLSYLPSTGPQTGTVTYVDLKTPSQLAVSGGPVTGTGSLDVTWTNQPDKSWLGVNGPVPLSGLKPSFLNSKIPLSFVPPLDGAKFTTGTFALGRLPVAVGVGAGHAQGVAPDPGNGTMGADTDYLGRNMNWQHFDSDLSYQPAVPDVTITLQSYFDGSAYVTIRSPLKGSSLFYKVSPATDFTEAVMPTITNDVHITILVAIGKKISAYAAKTGYNNSSIAFYLVPPQTP